MDSARRKSALANHFSSSGSPRHIEHKLRIAAVETGIEPERIISSRRVFQEHQQFREIDETFLHVVFAGDGAEVHDLRILGQRHLHAIDIGELIAPRT